MGLDFSPGSLFASMLIGTIGLSIFLYGKKQQRMPQLIAGMVLMGYPYFVTDVAWMCGVGGAIVVGLVLAVRAGL
jgi:uncharacterized membrane protein